jgi:toxin ParE1/3/4
MRVNWTDKAFFQLEAIGDYIAQDNPVRADTFKAEIEKKVDRLADFPHLYQVGEFDGIRELVAHKNYRVYYEVDDINQEVIILSVRHVRRDTPDEK